MILKRISLIASFLSFAFGAIAQEEVYPATINTQLLTHPEKKMLKSRVSSDMKDGDLIELPFIDDFSTDRFPGNAAGLPPLWTSRNATRNFSMAVNPRSAGTVTFDGVDAVGYPYTWSAGVGVADTLESVPIDLTGDASSGIGISFFYQPQGNAVFGPTAGVDSLRLELYAPELDQWFWAWSTVDVSETEEFTFVYLPITQPRYLKEGFKFRFRNFANLQGAFGVWNLDYLRLDQNNLNNSPVVDDIAFTLKENTLFKEYTEIPRPHYVNMDNPTGQMRESVDARLRNMSATNRTMVGNEIRILRDGALEGVFPNGNSPAIMAGSTLDYNHSVANEPNSFVYEADIQSGPLAFDVEILHNVQDIDATASNDTMRFQQRFFTDYAYDDGSAEWAYAVAGTGSEVAMQFTTFEEDEIFAVKIYTMPFGNNYENTSFTVSIWEDSGNGPGAPLAEELKGIVHGVDSYQQSIIYTFEEPVTVPQGSFYVGYRQSNQQNGMRVGLDRNTNANENHLWFNDQSQVWTPSLIEGTVMIRPMFTVPGWEDLVVSTNEAERFGSDILLYPNPTRDFFSSDLPDSSPADVRIFDVSGRLVQQERITSGDRIGTNNLPDGMYIVQFQLSGSEVFSKKLVVRH